MAITSHAGVRQCVTQAHIQLGMGKRGTMIKAHKIRLNPAAEQQAYFYRAAGVARFAWNWALNEYKRCKSAGEKVDWNRIKQRFRAGIDDEYPFVRAVTKCAAETAIRDLRQAINTYYKTKRTNPTSKVKLPGFRKLGKEIGGFGLNNDKFSVSGHTIRVPKLGAVNMAEVLRFDGKIMNGRIKETAGRWYVVIAVQVEDSFSALARPHRSVGIDFGLSRFATLSNGEVSETQAHLRHAERKLKRLQRGLARKEKGSANHAKLKLKIARAHERIARQRKDFLHKFTTRVARRFSIVCVEDLSLKGLVRTRLAKSFHDASIGRAINQIEYKAKERGGIVQKVNRFFPSSKLCHVCGSINRDLQLSDRVWVCRQCGIEHDRDQNGAVNIESEGVRLLVGSGFLDVTTVEFAASGSRFAFDLSRGL